MTSADRYPESADFKNRFTQRQAGLLYGKASIGLFGNALCASLLTYFYLGVTNTIILIGWYGTAMLVTLLRFALVIAYRYTRPDIHNQGWIQLFDAGTLISGLVWGAAPFLLLYNADFIYIVLLAVVISGLSAGIVTAYSASRYGATSFLLAANIPLLVALHRHESEFAMPLEILAAFFMLALLLITSRLHTVLARHIKLDLQNRSLIEYLRIQKSEADARNEQLKTEVEARKKAEFLSLENEKRFRSLSDASFEGILLHEHGKVLDANHTLAEMTGYAQQDMIGMSVERLVAPESHEVLRERLASPSEGPMEVTALTRNGERFQVQICGRDYPYHGRQVRVVAVRDLSKTRNVERSLRISEQRLARYMQQTLFAVIEWGADYRVMEWNPAAKRIFGYSYKEVVGRSVQELIVPRSERLHADRLWQRMLEERQPVTFTHSNVTKSGDTIICEWDVTPVIGDDGEVVVVIAFAHDITERVQAQEAVLHDKELAEVTLASLGDGV
ncbi:MAG: PAS domain-containing protein, partial [Granulosicoccaceae bacterium]